MGQLDGHNSLKKETLPVAEGMYIALLLDADNMVGHEN